MLHNNEKYLDMSERIVDAQAMYMKAAVDYYAGFWRGFIASLDYYAMFAEPNPQPCAPPKKKRK